VTSTLQGLLTGSGEFKTAALARLLERFPNVRLAIGDKFSDVNAYVRNGIPAVLIPDIQWDEDEQEYWREQAEQMRQVDAQVEVCKNWFEIEEAIFDARDYPPSRLMDQIREMLRQAPIDD
jgi:hypothetical protein